MAGTRNRFKGELTLGNVADEAPVSRGGADLSQFRNILQASWDKRQRRDAGEEITNLAIGITIPAEGAGLAESRFRQAATELGIGCTVTVYGPDTDRGRAAGLAQGQARMIVEARQKKAKPGTRKPAENANGNGAAVEAQANAAASTPTKRTGLPKPAAVAAKAK